MSESLNRITSAVVKGEYQEMALLTQTALDDGWLPKEILDKALVPGMDYVGAEFKVGQMFVPEVMLAARAMQASLDLLRPLLTATGAAMTGSIVIGTVKGDLHDIGKNLVAMMMEGAGFVVYDLGKDVAPQKFVEAVRQYHPDLVGMSALLTTTMRNMSVTIQALKDAGLRDQVKVMVGGAPVTPEYAVAIGADGYAPSAPAAVDTARKFVQGG